ncbi:MAG: hypothetical protein GY737_15345 [Desulfobacteraceae bacterium]|nr:hypothetical protein [Desulfobacteraceae bacterium]
MSPGGEGKVEIRLKTNGYGGRSLTKHIKVYTNDESSKNLVLKMTGKVEAIAKVTPKVVHLIGAPGDTIQRIVTIVPEKKYDFSIKEESLQSAKNNIGIELKRGKGDKKSWELVVTNKRTVVGRYYEVITLKTDSVFQPEMKIRVFGNVSAKGTLKSTTP